MNGGRDVVGRVLRAVPLAAAILALAGPAVAQFALPTDFTDELVVAGLLQPVGMAILPDGRLFVIERATARVRLIVNGALAAVDPVMTVQGVDASYGEEGLLGVAVDPVWPARPYVYFQYTDAGSQSTRISRFTVAGDLALTGNGALTIDPATRYDVLVGVTDIYDFHNGGTLRFGPDGMLYSSIGDPNICASQNRAIPLGKILRLEVSLLPPGAGGPAPKAIIIPPDNPFVAHPDSNARLVWQWGLRNPFRFGIDPQTGAMVIGDVGESVREELSYAPAPGLNFQWPIYEGDVPGQYTCAGVDSTLFRGPIHAYDHSQGAAVIGGVIYRRSGSATQPFPPEYDGDIFFTDFYGNWLRRLKRTGDTWSLAPATGQPNATDWGSGAIWISDWLVASDGSLWYCRMLTGNSTGPGQIRRIRYNGTVSVPGPAARPVEFRAPFPSPSRGRVTFEYALASDGPVSLTIHDAAGRRVCALAAGEARDAGLHRLEWDGRGGDGRRVAPGVYHVRLSVADHTLERRLVLID